MIVAIALVAQGVKDERRNGSFFSPRRPTLAAWLARRIVGGYIDLGRPANHEDLNGETVGHNGR